jgi:hypothetical protein
MMHTLYKKIFLFSIVVLFLSVLAPLHVFAARVYVETDKNPMNVGDTVIVNVKIDSENETINVVKGQIDLGTATDASLFKAGGMSIAGSILTIWPQEPLLSQDGHTISFEGGVPRGFNATDATLFTITVSARKPGTTNINPDNLETYLNDGKGTLTSTTGTGLSITIREATPPRISLKNILTIISIALAVILLICGVLFIKHRLKK